MAHIGMKYPVAAALTEADGTGEASYSNGFVVGKAISFTGTPSSANVALYADDGVAETDRSLQNLGTSMNVDDIALEIQAKLLGHTYTPAAENAPESMEVNVGDIAPYFGEGFYRRRKKNGVVSFTAIWLYKVQHAAMTENGETKGETVNFQTDTIEGTAYPLANGNTYKKATFQTEAAAKAWLNNLAGIAAAAGAGT